MDAANCLAPLVAAAGAETDFDFYSTAAQVIPLVFVALAFEFRGQGGQFLPSELQPGSSSAEDNASDQAILRYAAVYTFLMTLVLAAGEVGALLVIAYDNVWRGARFLVGASLTIGAVGIIVPIGVQQFNTWIRLRRLQARAAGQPSKEPEEAPVENIPLAALRFVSFLAAVFVLSFFAPVAVKWLLSL